MTKKLDVLAIVGPTASGKTALSVELAKLVDGEIINGDSTQVYKGLNIGTAKITEEEMDGIPHHLFDTKEPTENFSVAEYQSEVRKSIKDIQSRGKIPIIVGGTGLYIQSVLYDFRFTEEASNPEIRHRLEQVLEEKGPDFLYDQLMQVDPIAAEKIHPNNHRRIIRALEIIEVTGKPKDEHEQNAGKRSLFNHLLFGLDMDRQVLYERINRRCDIMMEQGFLEEVASLWKAGVRHTQAMQAIGYRELQQYLESAITYDEALETMKKSTRNYAKRQMTYFRNKLDVIWFDAEKGTEEIIKEISIILKDFEVLQRNR